MVFVDYISSKIDGLTSAFIQPGVVTTDSINIRVNKANKGKVGFEESTIFSEEAFAVALGRQMAAFHETSRQFTKDHPEAAKGMTDWQEWGDGILMSKGRTMPTIPKNEHTYGLCQIDAHENNIVIDVDDKYKISIFDWDFLSHCWFLVDVASMIHTRFFILGMNKSLTREETISKCKVFSDGLCQGYSPDSPIDKDHLRQACRFRNELFIQCFTVAIEEENIELLKLVFVSFKQDVAEGKFDFEWI